MLGLRFLFFPILTPAHPAGPGGGKRRVWMSAAGGAAVGLVCGVFGTGGGMMMLMVLGYELKTAVGTSVFIMTFSALLGAVSHFALGSAPSPGAVRGVHPLLGAAGGPHRRQGRPPLLLNRLTGAILTAVGLLLLVLNLL